MFGLAFEVVVSDAYGGLVVVVVVVVVVVTVVTTHCSTEMTPALSRLRWGLFRLTAPPKLNETDED